MVSEACLFTENLDHKYSHGIQNASLAGLHDYDILWHPLLLVDLYRQHFAAAVEMPVTTRNLSIR